MDADYMNRTIQLTEDGSPTLFVPDLDEHYHSIHGAVQESRHVFIEAGLKQLDKPRIRIFEVGFGTGLNAFLTLQETFGDRSLDIMYYAVERFPLEETFVSQLNYGSLHRTFFQKLHEAPWQSHQLITPHFSIYKIKGDSNTCLLPDELDLVYFDAFAPDKQPEMWNQEIFDKLYAHTRVGGLLTTYCAKGVVRRMMQKAGYTIERIPGPPGKREMLRARKLV
jgi:tRNA U34 5-methylaminomethyl-2-thiouridine-forming methyltransferase MnmC